MASTSLPKLIDVIICDDVRIERSGKFVVVGMYTGTIVMNRFPAKLPKLVFFMKWKVDAQNFVKGDFKIESPSGKALGEGYIDMSDAPKPPAAEGTAFVVGIIEVSPFSVDELGLYRILFRPPNRRWRKIFQFNVRKVVGQTHKKENAPAKAGA